MSTGGWLPAVAGLMLLPGTASRGQEPPAVPGPVRLAHDGPVYAVVFAPDGRTLYTGADDQTVRAWDVAGKELRRFPGNTGGVLAMALAAGGRTLASAGRDGTVRLWDTRSGKEVRRLAGPTTRSAGAPGVESLALSDDGLVLAAASSGRSELFRARPERLVPT
jgi:WD40 repeat protein